jgi:prepilin-type processing-associated H-X9-DG protein
MGLLLPLVILGQLTDNQRENQSHIKQAGLALLMYTNDYDDLYPSAQSTGGVIEVTLPYTKNLSIWWPVDGGRFLFNMAISGTTSPSIEAPAQTVAIYGDTKSSDGKLDVGFADGHAKRLAWADWSEAEKTLHLKIKKAAKPLPASLGAKYNTSKVPAARQTTQD